MSAMTESLSFLLICRAGRDVFGRLWVFASSQCKLTTLAAILAALELFQTSE